MLQYNPSITGSLTVTGSINASQGITGSLSGTVDGINVTSFSSSIVSSVSAVSNTVSAVSTSLNAVNNNTGSFATTGSNIFTGAQTVQGTLTAQTLVVQTVTSSVLFSTGSNIIGSSLSNVQQITGSLGVTGSATFNGALSGTTSTFSGSSGAFIGVTINNSDASGSSRLRVTSTGGNITDVISYSAAHASRANQAWIGGDGSSTITVLQAAGVEFLRGTSTGAATFASTISLADDLTLASTNPQIKWNAGNLRFTSLTAGNVMMTITEAGNVGLGVTTVGSWDTTIKAIEVGTTGNFYGGYSGGASVIYLGANAYYNSGWKYATSAAYKAQLLDAGGGNWHFQNAAAGTAGNAITWTSLMKITDTGNLNFYNSTSQLAFYGSNNFQINFGMIYNGSNLIATATDGGRIVMTDAGYEFKTFSGVTIGNTVTDASRMKIMNGGNVGIGTASPIDYTNYRSLHIMGATSTSSAILYLTNSTSSIRGLFYAEANQSRVTVGSQSNHDLTLVSNDTERIRVTSGGNILMGTSSDNGYRLRVSGGMYASSVYLQQTSANGGGTLTLANNDTFSDSGALIGQVNFYNTDADIPGVAAYMRAYTGASFGVGGQLGFGTQNTWSSGTLNQRMFIDNAGNIGAPSGTNIYNASDRRLKRNISSIEDGLSKVMALNPVKFNWIEKFVETEENKDMLGFIAQEVLPHIPEAVESFGESDLFINGAVIENPLRVNEKFITPVLVKAIQELKVENDTLKEILQRNNIV